MEKLNYEQDIEIDPEALDVEWCRQAKTFMQYSEQAAKARDTVNRLKERKDVVTAERTLNIRKSDPKVFGLDKFTEGSIQAIVLSHKDYQDITTQLAVAEYELDVLQSAVRAFDQKKSALENLVRLQGQNYFAGPTTPRELGKEFILDAERRASRGAVKRKLNR